MEEFTYVANVSKSGARTYINIPADQHENVKDKLGKQVKITIKEL